MKTRKQTQKMTEKNRKMCRLCLLEDELISNIFDNQRKILNCTLIECINYISTITVQFVQ